MPTPSYELFVGGGMAFDVSAKSSERTSAPYNELRGQTPLLQ